jgi:hypothetical protein
MRTEWLLGLFNTAGVVCFLAGPEFASVGLCAAVGSGFLAMSIGVVVVQSLREGMDVKEEDHGAG